MWLEKKKYCSSKWNWIIRTSFTFHTFLCRHPHWLWPDNKPSDDPEFHSVSCLMSALIHCPHRIRQIPFWMCKGVETTLFHDSLSIYPALFMFFFWRCAFFSSAVVGDCAAWQTESGGKLPTPSSIRCITNASTMDVKFLAMFDPNCRLSFPKSGKLVALLMLPDTLHPALHPVYYYQLWFAQSCRTFRVCSFS